MNTKPRAHLDRVLNLPLLLFYGIGTTIGAGIYVLVGAAAGHAGMYAPMAFIVAAIGLAPTSMAYAELSGRYPVSAGEAAYVKGGLRSQMLSNITGFLVICTGLVASATIAIGCAGYLSVFIGVSKDILLFAIIFLMGLVAIWGILESVVIAAVFTVIEVGALIVIIVMGFSSGSVDLSEMPDLIPSFSDGHIWAGIVNAGMLAVFAFIGFEDMVNVSEETKNPTKTMPWAIFLTLIITTILYALVTLVAIMAVPLVELSVSEAPLSLVFEKLTNASSLPISSVAIFATANTILVQFIMVSRVIYGMSERSSYFKLFSKVNRVTKTPIYATLAVMIITLLLALAFPIERLAKITSQLILLVWFLINIALVVIKIRKDPYDGDGFVAPFWVPIVGTLFCILFIILSFAS